MTQNRHQQFGDVIQGRATLGSPLMSIETTRGIAFDHMSDTELLTFLLMLVQPKKKAQRAAVALLDKFGDFNRVVSASALRLREIGDGCDTFISALKIVEAAAHRLARSRAMDRSIISSWDCLLDYCHTKLAHQATEQFRILFLDQKNVLIGDEEAGRGTVDHVPVYPREVIKRALELNASALILVHNHPTGDPEPSVHDIEMTNKIDDAARLMGLIVHDHVIIGTQTEFSFRSHGLLGNLRA